MATVAERTALPTAEFRFYEELNDFLAPRLRKLAIGSWGGTIQATHAQKIEREFLGQSDGTVPAAAARYARAQHESGPHCRIEQFGQSRHRALDTFLESLGLA